MGFGEEYKRTVKRLGYKACKNCVNQIEPLRGCKWLEQGGDGRLHLICPRWVKKENENDNSRKS